MPQLTIELPDEELAFAEAEAAAGQHASASAYLATLLRERRRQQTISRVQALLIERAQGEMKEMTRAELDEMRREAHT